MLFRDEFRARTAILLKKKITIDEGFVRSWTSAVYSAVAECVNSARATGSKRWKHEWCCKLYERHCNTKDERENKRRLERRPDQSNMTAAGAAATAAPATLVNAVAAMPSPAAPID